MLKVIMDLHKHRIEELLERDLYTLSPLEREELASLLDEAEMNEELKSVMRSMWEAIQPQEYFTIDTTNAIAENIFRASPSEMYGSPVRKRLWNNSWLRYAAAIIVTVGVFLFSLSNHKEKSHNPGSIYSSSSFTGIIPGKNKAVLTLSDGSIIPLDSANSAVLKQDNYTNIAHLGNGQISYVTNAKTTSSTKINTISTPRGGQYRVILSDGTKVWLNAVSSLTFPVSFQGKERIVKLSGEGYFEISKNTAMPFRLQVGDMEVSVLGTSFNVMAYDSGNQFNTTLLDGAVRVKKRNATVLLHPAQQAQWSNQLNSFAVTQADPEQAIAWKNGFFIFDGSELSSIMEQLSRWYDFDVKLDASVAGKKFSGTISRATSISQVLEMLALTKEASFTMKGRTIIVGR